MDTISGQYRFTFNISSLLEGVGIVPVAMGLFGISEVLLNLDSVIKRDIVSSQGEEPFPVPEGLG